MNFVDIIIRAVDKTGSAFSSIGTQLNKLGDRAVSAQDSLLGFPVKMSALLQIVTAGFRSASDNLTSIREGMHDYGAVLRSVRKDAEDFNQTLEKQKRIDEEIQAIRANEDRVTKARKDSQTPRTAEERRQILSESDTEALRTSEDIKRLEQNAKDFTEQLKAAVKAKQELATKVISPSVSTESQAYKNNLLAYQQQVKLVDQYVDKLREINTQLNRQRREQESIQQAQAELLKIQVLPDTVAEDSLKVNKAITAEKAAQAEEALRQKNIENELADNARARAQAERDIRNAVEEANDELQSQIDLQKTALANLSKSPLLISKWFGAKFGPHRTDTEVPVEGAMSAVLAGGNKLKTWLRDSAIKGPAPLSPDEAEFQKILSGARKSEAGGWKLNEREALAIVLDERRKAEAGTQKVIMDRQAEVAANTKVAADELKRLAKAN